MKKTSLLLTILFISSISFVNAQQKVAVHSNGATTIFSGSNAFVDAYNAAVTGDTLYLPGGIFTAPVTFDKGIAIIGAGFHPDSTLATLPTVLNGDINLNNDADGISFEGLLINNNLLKNYNYVCDNVTIIRCRVNGSCDFGNSGTPSTNSSDVVIFQSVFIGNVDLQGVENVLMSNCILQSQVLNSTGNTFRNNSFLKLTTSSGIFISGGNNVYLNNIFSTGAIAITVTAGNIFQNNIFANANPSLGLGVIDLNNYKGIDLSTVYTNQSGNVFDYAHDYHLLAAASTLYIGDDASQVGLYGGMFPLKDGFVPQNPHISTKTIAPTTDTNGDLQIQIHVEAQNN